MFDVFAATESLLAVSAGNSTPYPHWKSINPSLSLSNFVDPRKIGIMGGSHGGFLTAHCIGQRPSYFKAAVLRNPVTNILSNSTTSDIGDWCIVESCGMGSYDFSKYTSPEMKDIEQMYRCSPIRLIVQIFCIKFRI